MTLRSTVLAFLTATLSLSLAGCDLTGPDDTGSNNETGAPSTSGVFVANQGAFGNGNGSVSLYNPDSETSAPNAINGLGSIVQGIRLHNDRLYLTANSAGRLDVFSASDQTGTGQLSGLSGPRYLTFPEPETAFLTDQSFSASDSIRVVSTDGSSPTITSSIGVSSSGGIEGITHTSDRVYASLGAFRSTQKVAVVNTSARTLETEIDIGCTSRFVLADAQDEVFALCNNSTTGEVVILDGTQEQKRLSLPDSVDTTGPGQAGYYAPGAEELYIVVNKKQVVRINTATNQKSTTITPEGTGPIGAIGYDPADERLYVGRADPSKPFSASGHVTIHDRDGTKVGSFEAGIAPDYIDFY